MNSKILSIPLVHQYDTPFCFYACTSMVLSYFGIDKSVAEISHEVSFNFPGDSVDVLGETAGQIKDYLSDYGLEAHLYTDQDWDSIKQHIDGSHPLIVGVKASPTDLKPNHAWVIRGYDDSNDKKVIYNNPWYDPGSQDPVTYDPDPDGFPGSSMAYDYFVNNHWTAPIPLGNRSFIAVSYKGQGAGKDYFDWRGVGGRNVSRSMYHTLRLTEKFYGFEWVEAFIESIIAAIAFVGWMVAGIQFIGQLLEKAGHALIDKGKELWKNGGVGGKLLGGTLIALGGIIAGIGYLIDFVTGVVGIVVDAITSAFDAIGSFITGSRGGSDSVKLGDTNVNLGLNLTVRPWKSRWGDNWEKISGSWTVAIEDFSNVDKLEIWWSVNIWGWGIDSWSLSHSTIESAGTVSQDTLVQDGSHHKKFFMEMTNAQGIRKAFGENKCYYGRDGGMTRVQLKVETRATLNGESVTVEESISTYGIST